MESTSIKHIVQFLSCREYGSSRHHAIPRSCHDADAAQLIAEERATIPSKNQACELSGQTRATFLMVYSPDGTRMASTHGDHTVRVTHVLSGRCLHILRGHPRTPWCVAFHPSSPDIVASGCLAGEVRIWDLRGGGSEVWRCSKGVSIASLAFHPTSQLLVVAVSNEVVFWDWTQPEPFAACKTAHDYEKVRWVKFDPLGHNLYTGIANGATVHAEPSDVSFVPSDVGGGQAHSRYSTEERARLQRQYQHIVDEIASLRRERLNNQLPPGFVGAWSRAGPSGVGGHPPSPPRPARDGTHFSSSSSSSSCSSASSSSSSSSSAAGLMQRDPGPSGPHGPGSAVAGADSGWQGESRQPLSRVQAEAVELARMYAASTQGTGHGSTAAAGSEAGHPPAMEGGVAPGSPAQPSATSAHTVSSLEALLQEPTPVTTLGGGRRGGATDGDSAVGAESGLGSGYGPGSGPAELEGYRPRSWRQMLLQIGPRNLTPDYVPTARALDTSALSPMLSRNAVSNTVPRLQPPRRYERAAGLTDPRPHTTPLGGGDDSGAAGSYPATGRGLLPRAPNPTIRIIPCDSSSGATPPTVHGGHVAATPALPAPGDNFAAFGTSAPAGAVPPDYDVIPGTGGSSGFTGVPAPAPAPAPAPGPAPAASTSRSAAAVPFSLTSTAARRSLLSTLASTSAPTLASMTSFLRSQLTSTSTSASTVLTPPASGSSYTPSNTVRPVTVVTLESPPPGEARRAARRTAFTSHRRLSLLRPSIPVVTSSHANSATGTPSPRGYMAPRDTLTPRGTPAPSGSSAFSSSIWPASGGMGLRPGRTGAAAAAATPPPTPTPTPTPPPIPPRSPTARGSVARLQSRLHAYLCRGGPRGGRAAGRSNSGGRVHRSHQMHGRCRSRPYLPSPHRCPAAGAGRCQECGGRPAARTDSAPGSDTGPVSGFRSVSASGSGLVSGSGPGSGSAGPPGGDRQSPPLIQRMLPVMPSMVTRSTGNQEESSVGGSGGNGGGGAGAGAAAAVGAHGPGSPGGRRELGCPSRRLATLIESEVREALDQVRARRLDISETLSDLDTLRQELELQQTTPDGPSGGEIDTRDPGEEEARDTNDLATALMARMRPALACHHQARSPPELPGTSHDVDATLSGDTSNTGLGINPPDPDFPPIRESTLRPEEAMEAGSLGDALDDLPSLDLEAPGLDGVGVEGGDSPASSGSGSSVDSLDRLLSIDDENNNGDDNNNNQDPEVTLNAIGSYSAEIERRVQQLDQRISEIQARLQDRLQSLQNERERGQTRMRGGRLSSTQYSSFSERLRQRHERLRAHLESLRQSYNTSRGRLGAPASAAGSNPEPVPSGEDGRSLPGQLTDHRNSRTTTPHDPHPQRGVDPWAPRNRPPFRDRIRNLRYEMARRRRDSRDQERSWHSLQRRHLHPHYAVGILDETVNRPDEGIRSAINRAIAGAFIASGESTVASNIMNTTYRIQRWDFYKYRIPDLTRIDENVVVPHCKIHNDATVDMSQDGRLLATFVPSHRGFPDDSILGVFSLQPDTFRRCLYTKSFGPNFVSVSLSPLNNYALVGLASKRLSWVFTPKQMVAQVFQLTNPMAGEDSVEHICDLMHPCDVDIRAPVSVNSARWLPTVGDGIVYGTNRGDLHICRPGFEQETKRPEAGDGTAAGGHPENTSIRRNLMHLLGMTVPRAISIATQTVQRVRRTASTQTDSEDL